MPIHGKARVLAIDDEPAVLENIVAYLEDSGYEMYKAANGRIGLDLFRAVHPDIVLVDLRMPEVDGLTVLNTVTREEPEIPIIVVSGTGIIRDAVEALRMGAWDFITKPISDMAVLEHAVQKALERGVLRRENLRYREHLEEEIRRRTQELEHANEQLKQEMEQRRRMESEIVKARKLESMGLLAGGIAHDFNNILAAIIGNISMAKIYAKPQEKAFKRLAEAEKAALRARDLTQQLLTFAKGGAPIKKTASIAQLIRECGDFALSGSAVRCEYQLPDNLWALEIDAGQIGQVVHNLVLNAVQAMSSGGVITVTAHNQLLGDGEIPGLPAGQYVRVAVIDQGPGIPPQHIDRIFDPYFTTKPNGTGLGLAGAYSIIKNHEGYIGFETGPQGTTFHFHLPATPARPAGGKEEEEPLHKGSGRVLVMDDDPIVLDISSEILQYFGYQADAARDGREAEMRFKAAKESGAPYRMVILDLTIPGGLGAYETLKALQKIDPMVKAVITSGYANDPLIMRCREYGFFGKLVKPFKIEDLSELLHQLEE